MHRIVAIGDLNEDLLIEVDELPEQDSQIVACQTTSSGWGSAANFAVACSKLGEDVALYAAVGNDHRGRWLIENVSGYGVDIEGIVTLNDTPTGITVSISHKGMRTMFSNQGTNKIFKGNRFITNNINAKWVHLTSYFLLPGLRASIQTIVRDLCESGIPISFDPGWHQGTMHKEDLEMVRLIISNAELFCPNLIEAKAYLLGNNEDAEILAFKGVEAGAKICCITLGEGGCCIYSSLWRT